MSGHHANRGKAFEELLGHWHARYARQGAYVQRNPTPYKILGRHGLRLIAVPERDAPPDFLVASQGRVILLDAKSHRGARWPLGELAPHQARAFMDWTAQGEAFVAGVVLQLEDECWWIDWRSIEAAWATAAEGKAATGSASLSIPWLRKHAHLAPKGDWLPAALAAHGAAA